VSLGKVINVIASTFDVLDWTQGAARLEDGNGHFAVFWSRYLDK